MEKRIEHISKGRFLSAGDIQRKTCHTGSEQADQKRGYNTDCKLADLAENRSSGKNPQRDQDRKKIQCGQQCSGACHHAVTADQGFSCQLFQFGRTFLFFIHGKFSFDVVIDAAVQSAEPLRSVSKLPDQIMVPLSGEVSGVLYQPSPGEK